MGQFTPTCQNVSVVVIKIVAAIMVTLLVKGGCGDHGGGGHTGSGNGVELHVLVVTMVALVPVVTLVVGSILTMKALPEMAAVAVAVARGRKIAKYRRKSTHKASEFNVLAKRKQF